MCVYACGGVHCGIFSVCVCVCLCLCSVCLCDCMHVWVCNPTLVVITERVRLEFLRRLEVVAVAWTWSRGQGDKPDMVKSPWFTHRKWGVPCNATTLLSNHNHLNPVVISGSNNGPFSPDVRHLRFNAFEAGISSIHRHKGYMSSFSMVSVFARNRQLFMPALHQKRNLSDVNEKKENHPSRQQNIIQSKRKKT